MRAWTVAATIGLAVWMAPGAGADGNTLVGWATLPVDTYADGPTAGHFARSQFGHTLPLENRQVVQGFSGVIAGPAPGTYYVIMDNGFGAKANSADALLRVDAVKPNFETGEVTPVNRFTWRMSLSFEAQPRIIYDRSPERRSLSAMCGGKAAPRGSSAILLAT